MKILMTTLALLMSISVFGKGCHFDGEWKPQKKDIPIPPPIIGNIDETRNILSLTFLEDLGDIYISILDSDGNVIYQESLIGDSNFDFIIDLKNIILKNNIIYIYDKTGNYAYSNIN